MSNIDSFELVALQPRPSQSLSAYVRRNGTTQTATQYQHFVKTAIASATLPAGPAVRLSFRARSVPDPVTGKQVALAIDRYYVAGRSHLAVITLATPVGVDNVDAFHRIARSFTWIHA